MKKTISIIFLLVTSILLLAGCGNAASLKGDYVIKIDDAYVGDSEFKLYLYETQRYFIESGGEDIWDTDFDGRTAGDVAKDAAINTIKMVKLASKKAGELDITLTDEEIEKAKEEGDSLMGELSDIQKSEMNITIDEVYSIMHEKALFIKVYDRISTSYEIDEEEFSSYFDPDAEGYADIYTKFYIEEVIFDTKADADKLKDLGPDENFLEKALELGAEAYESEYYKGEMEDMLGIRFDLDPGETSDIIEMGSGFYMFKLISIEEPDEEATREFVKSIYEYNNSQEYFNQEFEKWTNAADIEINQNALNEISISTK